MGMIGRGEYSKPPPNEGVGQIGSYKTQNHDKTRGVHQCTAPFFSILGCIPEHNMMEFYKRETVK